MKARESGMPDEDLWESFFDPKATLDLLSVYPGVGNIAEFGCGFGTFTIPAARRSTGSIYAFDIDPDMVNAVTTRICRTGVRNVVVELRDFLAEGTGLPECSMNYVMLFNILHAENPLGILREAKRILQPGGTAGIIHWINDPNTPRGPSLAIRPRPEDCLGWAFQAGLEPGTHRAIELPPYHFGLTVRKPLAPQPRGELPTQPTCRKSSSRSELS